MVSDAPIYLVSVPRSGATLLGAMLNGHQRIAMFNEPWFFHMLPKYGTLQRRRNAEMLVDDLCAAASRFGVWLSDDFKGRVLASLYELKSPEPLDAFGLFLGLYAKHMGKDRWGIKQPFGLLDISRLQAYFPDMKVIHIVRDPRATAAHRMGKELGGKENLVDSLRFSRSCLQTIAHIKHVTSLGSMNYLELKYEELVRDSEGALRGICQFLNEDYDPQMLEYHTTLNPYVPRDQNGQPRNTHAGVLSPVHNRDVDAWKSLLTWREIAIVERVCLGEMIKRGYHPIVSGRKVKGTLFLMTAICLRLRLANSFLRRSVFEGMFHLCRRALIFLHFRYEGKSI